MTPFRIGVLTFVLTVLCAAIANAAVLNPSVTLHSDVLTVGDVFTDAGANKDHVLGPAPKAGDVMVLNAKTLNHISRSFGVQWVAARGTETTIVRRSAAVGSKADKPETIVSLPVLVRPLSRDDVITQGDLTTIDLSSKKLKDDTVLDVAKLVGMSARGLIQANEPVSANLLQSPKMIKRNDLVTLTLNAGRISLTAQARALHDARLGDMVKLQNPNSEKIVQAKVTGPQEAIIDTVNQNQGG